MNRTSHRLALSVVGALALAAFVATSTPALAADAPPNVLRGSVLIRDKTPLPDDAEVVVRLLDDTKPLAPVLVAEAKVMTAGRQPPIPFALEIDPAKATGKRHTLHAAIRYGGQTRYVTAARIVVNPAKLPESLTMMVKAGDQEPDFTESPMPSPTGRTRLPGK